MTSDNVNLHKVAFTEVTTFSGLMFLENFKGFFSIYSYVNVQPLVVHNFNKLALILTEDASTLVTIFLTDRFQRGMIFKICENSILPCFGPTLPMGIMV